MVRYICPLEVGTVMVVILCTFLVVILVIQV